MLSKLGSSSAMEADIIVEGFRNSESMHGLRYKKFIADGDSSVYCRIIERVPYGHNVTKLECPNHCVKNYTGALHKLAADTKYPVGGRKTLKGLIPRLTKAARCAITYISKNNGTVDELRHDLSNGPLHVFGVHTRCRDYFCKNKNEAEVVIDQTKSNVHKTMRESGLFPQIMAQLDRVIRKADRLFQNETSNRAELFMSLVAKYISGKRINYSQSGGYKRRCVIAGLSYQKGPAWHTSPYRRLSGKSPGLHFKTFVARATRKKVLAGKRLFSKTPKKSKSTNPLPPVDVEYGPLAEQPALSPQELEAACENKLHNLQVTKEERDAIEVQSRGQHGNSIYDSQRSQRLTASNFGKVIKRLPKTSCHSLVKELLYKVPFSTESTKYGKDNESVALRIFEETENKMVRPSGLYIDIDNGFLGASPDGVIDSENAIVEVKTVPSARKNTSGKKIEEQIAKNKQFCLEKGHDGNRIKKSHPYYLQIQGQLNIANKDKCYFVLFVDKDTPLHIEIIEKDEECWKLKMLPKLIQFYRECILPEIIEPPIPLGKKCKDPTYILEAQSKTRKRKNVPQKLSQAKKPK